MAGRPSQIQTSQRRTTHCLPAIVGRCSVESGFPEARCIAIGGTEYCILAWEYIFGSTAAGAAKDCGLAFLCAWYMVSTAVPDHVQRMSSRTRLQAAFQYMTLSLACVEVCLGGMDVSAQVASQHMRGLFAATRQQTRGKPRGGAEQLVRCSPDLASGSFSGTALVARGWRQWSTSSCG